MIVIVEIGGGRLPQDISAAPILWPSRPWKYPASSVFRFPPYDRESETLIPRSLTRNEREKGVSRLNLSEINDDSIPSCWIPSLSFSSPSFSFSFHFQCRAGYDANPTLQRIEGGEVRKRGKKEERRGKGVHDSTPKAVGLNNSNLSVLEKLNLIIQSNRRGRTVTSRGDHSTGRTRSKMQYPGSIS